MRLTCRCFSTAAATTLSLLFPDSFFLFIFLVRSFVRSSDATPFGIREIRARPAVIARVLLSIENVQFEHISRNSFSTYEMMMMTKEKNI